MTLKERTEQDISKYVKRFERKHGLKCKKIDFETGKIELECYTVNFFDLKIDVDYKINGSQIFDWQKLIEMSKTDMSYFEWLIFWNHIKI